MIIVFVVVVLLWFLFVCLFVFFFLLDNERVSAISIGASDLGLGVIYEIRF